MKWKGAALEETGQWLRIKELFDAALERDAGAREEFLCDACGEDAELRAEIESLLEAHGHAGFLSQSPVRLESPKEFHEQEMIGNYCLVRKIGEGGMGQVWLADQTEPIRRQVALKLIRAGLFDDSQVQRFQVERQSLAMMEHPAIAKVFDAGATETGQPFLVMEYVPGEPITRYCDRKKLTVRERLELFAKVCDGVQHAHQKAVIHRDLKPANILITEVDGQPAPRIIDFGLASAVEAGTGNQAARAEKVAGTPGYMSPEQKAGTDVDTRTDVYSLGVVLYQLLTDTLPFPAQQRSGDGVGSGDAALTLPSAKAAKAANVDGLAAKRNCSARQLARRLRGDLDLIAAKALERDRSRRYGTALELAADIRRLLANRPVEAHAASKRYAFSKYVRRHRVGAAMAGALAVLVVGFAVLQAMALRRITQERDRAARISDFMVSSFRVVDPSEARGNQVTAREILDKASTQIDQGLSREPEMQSQMLMVMGSVYENLGLYSRAESIYRKAVANREQQQGANSDGALKARASLAWVLYRRGQYKESEQILQAVLRERMKRNGANNADTVTVMDYLGAVLNDEGNAKQAEELARQALDYRMRTLGPNNAATLVSMGHLALTLQSQARWPEAESLDRQQLEGWHRLEGEDSPRGLGAADNLAIILYRENRLAEAEALDRKTLATKKRVLGPDHPETVRSMNTLTAVLTDEGKLDEALELERDVVAIRTRVLGAEHHLTLSAMSNLAEILTRKGELNEAQQLLVKARDGEARVLGPDHPATATATYNLACLMLKKNQPTEALKLLNDAVEHGLPAWIAKGMDSDPDLAALRGDVRFKALVAGVAQKQQEKGRD